MLCGLALACLRALCAPKQRTAGLGSAGISFASRNCRWLSMRPLPLGFTCKGVADH